MPADSGERTEPATPRRLREARERGQVARSQDLTAAVLLLFGFLGMALLGPSIYGSLIGIIKGALVTETPTRIDDTLVYAGTAALEAMKRIAPLLAILFFSVLAISYAQVGNLATLKPLTPSLSKLSPLSGLKRLFSSRSVVTALVNFGKLFAVGAIAYFVIADSAAAILYTLSLETIDIFHLGASLVFRLAMWLSMALVLIALLDYVWQRYRHIKDLRMTKEEVKDELRSMEGDPKIKARRREVQMRLALQRVRKEVPSADVVVTNPTHYAVAIRYDVEAMVAPKVVAKGADYMALRIRQVAAEFGVPVVERRVLARALYETVDIGAYVPERFYRAIAEILAYVYELTGRVPAPARPAMAGAP